MMQARHERITTAGGSSHLAVGTEGRFAVRVSAISASANRFDADAERIAVSTNHGVTWSIHPTPEAVTWDPSFTDPTAVPRWVEPLAWTDDGLLHHEWSRGESLMHAASADNALWGFSYWRPTGDQPAR